MRGYLQNGGLNYDSEGLYTPVLVLRLIRTLILPAASCNLHPKRFAISNAYIYRNTDVPVIMKQPTDSQRQIKKPRFHCLLQKSLYEARQERRIWEDYLHDKLTLWKFDQSAFEPRLYFFKAKSYFIAMCVVVASIAFTSDVAFALQYFKDCTKSAFDGKLHGPLTSFIRRGITKTSHALSVSQKAYTERLLDHFGMHRCSPMQTPLLADANIERRHQDEETFDMEDHHRY